MAMFIRYKDYFGKGADIYEWNIEEYCGYEPITTYYTDFSIADYYGIGAVIDTYQRARMQAMRMGHKWLTELVMVLNWKIHEWYGLHNDSENPDALSKVYDGLWRELSEFTRNHLKGDELLYYYRTVD